MYCCNHVHQSLLCKIIKVLCSRLDSQDNQSLFCSRSGRFYCRNHFVQLTAPKCEGCHQPFRYWKYFVFLKVFNTWSSKSKVHVLTEKPSLHCYCQRGRAGSDYRPGGGETLSTTLRGKLSNRRRRPQPPQLRRHRWKGEERTKEKTISHLLLPMLCLPQDLKGKGGGKGGF